MNTKEVEDKLFNFFYDKMDTDQTEIEDIMKYEDYLCTINKGIVINCKDGTQIRLTIHVC